jgi:hypothetical protein
MLLNNSPIKSGNSRREIIMDINIKKELLKQLSEINARLDNVDDSKEWAILQVAKSNVLSSLQLYFEQRRS